MSILCLREANNILCAEGGTLVLSVLSFFTEASPIRSKGADRQDLVSGKADGWRWLELGSHFVFANLPLSFVILRLSNLEENSFRRNERVRRDHVLRYPWSGKIGNAAFRANSVAEGNLRAFWMALNRRNDKDELIILLRTPRIDSRFCDRNSVSSVYVWSHTSNHGGNRPRSRCPSDKLVRLELKKAITDEAIEISATAFKSFGA